MQVQRDGKTIAHLDFYELLVKGDKSKDVRLQSGDVMYFPPVGPLVAVAGSVNTPAIYEVKHDSSLADADRNCRRPEHRGRFEQDHGRTHRRS